MKKLTIFAFLTVLFLSACKKDTPTTTCTFNSSSVAGTYKITSFIYKADATSPEVETFTTFPDCQKDDLLTFISDGTYTVSEGTLSCNPSTSDNGTWSIIGNNLVIDGETSEVLNFSCSGFKVKTTDTTTGETFTITLAKQ